MPKKKQQGMTTAKQQHILHALLELGHTHPTVRSLADHLESKQFRSERFSDDAVRGQLERLEADGLVVQFEGDKGEQRYRLATDDG